MSMEGRRKNNIVLSYHDCLLRDTDVELLRGPRWLNDTVVGFYFEYLEKRPDYSKSAELLFVSPELTQLLKLTSPSEYETLLGSVNAYDRPFVFFPLNNCDSRDRAGGTHWSLLVYSRIERSCFHVDSSKGLNAKIAGEFAKNLMECLLGENSFGEFQEVSCPQQDNGYDCGLFVLCCADLIADCVVSKRQVKGCDYNDLRNLVDGKRKGLLELIDGLSKTPETKR